MFVENLIKLGFNQKEAEVYLMLLRVGPSPVSSLAQRIGLKRASVYSVLDSLMVRGLVSFEQSGNCRRYIPHDPECLLFGLERQNAELRCQMDLAKTCVDGLNRTVCGGNPGKRKICYFRGIKTIQDALQERVDSKSALFVMFLNFAGSPLSSECLYKFLENYKGMRKVRLCVPAEREGIAKKAFPEATCCTLNMRGAAINGELLIQEDRVFFIFSHEKDVQMMYVNDPVYAKFLCCFTSSFS